MSISIDTLLLIFILLATILIVYIFWRKTENRIVKVLLFSISLSLFMYSGYGIAYDDIDNKYIINYLIYLICVLFPIFYVNRKSGDSYSGFTKFDAIIIHHYSTIKTLAFLYVLLKFIPVFYPSFTLFDALRLKIAVQSDFFKLQQAFNQSIVGNLDSISNFTLPFFFVVLYKLKADNKTVKLFFLILLFVFLQYARFLYLGRYQMVIYGLFLFITLFAFKDNLIEIKKKIVLTICAVLFLLVPVFYSYTFFRLGLDADRLSYTDSLTLLLDSEARYPQYYDMITRFSHSIIYVLEWFLWIICLPIPSILWGAKPAALFGDDFTRMVTGLDRMDGGYSILLPSLLGESMFVFGPILFFIHGLVVGIIIAYVFKYVNRNATLSVFALYLALSTFAIGRGGTGSVLPPIINYSIALWLFFIFIRK